MPITIQKHFVAFEMLSVYLIQLYWLLLKITAQSESFFFFVCTVNFKKKIVKNHFPFQFSGIKLNVCKNDKSETLKQRQCLRLSMCFALYRITNMSRENNQEKKRRQKKE